MSKRYILNLTGAVLLGALAPALCAAERPNILWLVSEDNGPFLGCYGDKLARTPHLDKLAGQGVLYLNAFSNAPVCAPSRSTLITGMYASSLGTQHMRSTYKIPEHVKLYPQYLREAGYYCLNPGKTDYNIAQPKPGWEKGGDWNARKPGQPFFCVLNTAITHESSLHGNAGGDARATKDAAGRDAGPTKDAGATNMPPYHPDTPEIRNDWARYYQIITKMDAHMGGLLEKLEKDGLAEDTIVFYFSDHGGILPRSKRFLYDTGLHVPLIVRFPKKFEHLAPGKPGSRIERLVSFVDFPPTLLSLCGIEIPAHMQGVAFLGEKQGPPREYVYGFRGRMDERYDLSYTVRDARYRYVRHYMPHRIYGQHLGYLWKMPATRSWEQAYKEGKCNRVQSVFWQPKPVEELYDSQNDPWEVKNLADSPEHREILDRLRKANRAHLLKIRDTGFLPEPEMIARAGDAAIHSMAQDDKLYPLQRILDAAEIAAGRDKEALPKLAEFMKESDAAMRYWGAVGCRVRETPPKQRGAEETALLGLLKDGVPCVRIAAAEALCVYGHPDKGLPVLVEALDEKGMNGLMALNALHAIAGTQKIDGATASQIARKAPTDGEYNSRAAAVLRELLDKARERGE